MLAPEVPGNVHQLHRIHRAAAAPGRAGAVGGFAFERVLDRNEPVAAALAPARAEIAADVVVEHDVGVLEDALADVIRLGAELFFGNAGPQHDRAGNLLAFHDALHRE